MKKHVTVLLWCLALTVLFGCGQSENMPSQSEAEGRDTQWRTEGFATPRELEEEQVFWAGEYLSWEHKSQASIVGAEELSYLDSGVCGELFWYFGTELGSGGMLVPGPEGEYVLEIYNTSNGECTVKRFSTGELGLEGELGYLVGMDMLDGENYMFRWVDYEQDEEGMYHQTVDRMVYTDLADDLQTVDFWEIYLEKGIEQEETTELPLWQLINWSCDRKGNSYVIKQKGDGSFRFYLFDRNGEILMDYEGTLGQHLSEPLRTQEGELIFPVYESSEKSYEFLWVDTEEGEFCSLARMEASMPYILQMYGMLGDDIFYRSREGAEKGTGEGIVRWNIRSGRRVLVLDFRTVGIDTSFQTMLALRDGQAPFIRLTKYKEGRYEEWLTALSEQRMDSGDIRVADLTIAAEPKEWIEQCTTLASMENPNFRYEYEDVSAQEARDRILIELSQGKGPDLMFVSIEDMYMLEEKGLLMDIRELIPQEIQEEFLPGALEIGTVDGRLLGMPVGIRAETMVVAGDIWSEDTWRLEDVISLMEEGKLVGAIRSPYQMGDYLSPLLTVQELVVYSLGDSFLIDWENGKSHFDDERFVRLLELTSTDFSNGSHETADWLNEGQNIVWGYFQGVPSFLEFFAHMEAEGGRIIGFPTEGACGSYLVAEGGVMVVNANIAKKKEVACFLETLLGDEIQYQSNLLCLGVRKLDPKYYIGRNESGRLTFMGGEFAPEVPVFQDGTTSLDRAKDFLENCVALPPRYPQIIRIIIEELNAMYAENRPPETTAEIINNRVQLYLDEEN